MPIRPAVRTKGKRREAVRNVRSALSGQRPPSALWVISSVFWLERLLTMTTNYSFRIKLEYRASWEKPYSEISFDDAREIARSRAWEDD